MPKGLSLYLDGLRFCLAMVVWTGHSTLHNFTGPGFVLWFMYPYMQTAVIGFFVLSGFVIAHVSATTETTLQSYAVARASRLYSIVVPALLLTFACDTLGQAIDPALYVAVPFGHLAHPFLRYLTSLGLVNNFATIGAGPAGTNAPFWSLSYELTYYIVFGVFMTRNIKIWLPGAIGIFLLAGVDILLLFPVWLLGVVSYRVGQRYAMPPVVALLLFPVTALLIMKVGWVRATNPSFRIYHIDYAVALLMAFHIYAAWGLSRWLKKALGWCSKLVRWLGSLTFAIYLCHYPLMAFLSAARIDRPGTAVEQLWLFGASFIIISAIAAVSDRGRQYVRNNWHKAMEGHVAILPTISISHSSRLH